MTTIYMNVKKGIAYSDSQTTWTSVKKQYLVGKKVRKVIDTTQEPKLFFINKCIVATAGSCAVTDNLFRVFEEGKDPLTLAGVMKIKEWGSLYMMRKGYIIYYGNNAKGVLSKKIYFCDWLTTGSGAETSLLQKAQYKLNSLTPEQIFKTLRINSLFDQYSDDKIVCMNLDQTEF